MTMNYLIDTHILLQWMTGDDRLPKSVRSIIEKEPVWLSEVSTWELVTKEQKGKLKLPHTFEHDMRSIGFIRLDVDLNHVADYRKLPRLHADPFDRMLIAQARVEGLTLITADKRFAKYDVSVKLVQP
jgi:PIN domain nuclease of toxin-antitoxin system